MTRFYNDLVDFIENFRGKFLYVVFNRLQAVGFIIIDQSMAQHLAYGFMLIHQLQQPVIVAVQVQPDAGHDENFP